MNALECIRNVGKQIPTFSSDVLSTTKSFFDPIKEIERRNNLDKHTEIVHTYLSKNVYTH